MQTLGQDRGRHGCRGRLAACLEKPAPQVVRQVGRGQVTVAHLARQATETDPFKLARYLVAELAGRPGLAIENLVEVLDGTFAAKWQPPGQAAVENHSQSPDVRTPVQSIGLATNLFGRHVRQRAGDLATPQPLDLFVNRQAEIADPGLTKPVNEDVRRLQVAVDQAECVGILDCLGDLRDDLGQMFRRHVRLPKQFLQVHTLNILKHDEAARTTCLFRIAVGWGTDKLTDFENARVIKRVQPLRLFGKRHQALASQQVAGPSNLDGDFSQVLIVVSQENQKVPLTQQSEHPESADLIWHDDRTPGAVHSRIPFDLMG